LRGEFAIRAFSRAFPRQCTLYRYIVISTTPKNEF